MACNGIPCSGEQGILFAEQGIFAGGQGIFAKSPSVLRKCMPSAATAEPSIRARLDLPAIIGFNMPLAKDWSALLEEERRLRAAVIELGEPCDAGALRRWWTAVAAVLIAMVRPDGKFLGELPMELFAEL